MHGCGLTKEYRDAIDFSRFTGMEQRLGSLTLAAGLVASDSINNVPMERFVERTATYDAHWVTVN